MFHKALFYISRQKSLNFLHIYNDLFSILLMCDQEPDVHLSASPHITENQPLCCRAYYPQRRHLGTRFLMLQTVPDTW